MNKLIVTALLVILCFSCKQSKQKTAEASVTNYLKSTLNDPNSYENVSFGPLIALKDTVIYREDKPDTIKYYGTHAMLHTYRGKNIFGAVLTKAEWFRLDSTLKIVDCCLRKPESFVEDK